MRIIVTGGRDYDDWESVYAVLSAYDDHDKPVLVHGACRTGADAIADAIAGDLGWTRQPFPPASDGSQARALVMRNEAMAAAGADVCLVFPGNRGTADMATRARDHHIPIVRVTDNGETVAEPVQHPLF